MKNHSTILIYEIIGLIGIAMELTSLLGRMQHNKRQKIRPPAVVPGGE